MSWLSTLGITTVDWKNHELDICWHRGMASIKGNDNKQTRNVSSQSVITQSTKVVEDSYFATEVRPRAQVDKGSKILNPSNKPFKVYVRNVKN